MTPPPEPIPGCATVKGLMENKNQSILPNLALVLLSLALSLNQSVSSPKSISLLPNLALLNLALVLLSLALSRSRSHSCSPSQSCSPQFCSSSPSRSTRSRSLSPCSLPLTCSSLPSNSLVSWRSRSPLPPRTPSRSPSSLAYSPTQRPLSSDSLLSSYVQACSPFQYTKDSLSSPESPIAGPSGWVRSRPPTPYQLDESLSSIYSSSSNSDPTYYPSTISLSSDSFPSPTSSAKLYALFRLSLPTQTLLPQKYPPSRIQTNNSLLDCFSTSMPILLVSGQEFTKFK